MELKEFTAIIRLHMDYLRRIADKIFLNKKVD
jgi:hypothetical protein